MSKGFNEFFRYEVYVGIKDKDTYEEYLTSDGFAEIVREYLEKNRVDYSFHLQSGGYKHNKGYVTETSMRITLIGIEYDTLLEVVKHIKKTVNTDTVMITKETIEAEFV